MFQRIRTPWPNSRRDENIMVNDLISDFLARVKNGYLARRKTVTAPYSKNLQKLGELLVANNYLEKVSVQKLEIAKGKSKKEILLTLKYEGRRPIFTDMVRVSKPGRRVYIKAKKIYPVFSGFGFSVVSTPKGLMTGKDARKKKLGGELICKIW